MDDVKAARERLSGVWTVGYVEDNCRERLVNDVHTLLSDHARLSAEVERLSGHPATEAREQMLDAAESPARGQEVDHG